MNTASNGQAQGQRIKVREREQLLALIAENIKANGPQCSLCHLDVSKVTSMARMFSNCPFAQDVRAWSISPTTRVNNMFSGKNEAQWPSQILAKLDEVLPEWQKRQRYLEQSYLRGAHVGHIVSDLRFGPPSYFNRATVETMKVQQRVAENLGMSPQEAAIYIFEQLLKPTPQATLAGFDDFQLS